MKTLIMPPPSPFFSPGGNDYSDLAAITRQAPERLGFLAGGGSLNPMVQQALQAGTVSPQLEQQFRQAAAAIVQAGAVGFGEVTAEHLSFNPSHPYVSAPADHPLFKLLADLAAQFGLPVNFHMEAVPQEMTTPPQFRNLSSNNPATLHENISGFERLLGHNRAAKIVWYQGGWDNTGQLTPALVRRLLQAHPNLYMGMKIPITVQPLGQLPSRPLDQNGRLRPEWQDLFTSFPDRFMLVTDSFYNESTSMDASPIRSLLTQLPSDLARKLGYENALALYKL